MIPQFHLGDKVNVIINGRQTHGKIIAYPNGPIRVHDRGLHNSGNLHYDFNYTHRRIMKDVFTDNGEMYAMSLEPDWFYLIKLVSNQIVQLREKDLFEFQNIVKDVVNETMNKISKWEHPVKKTRLPSELNDNIESYLWHLSPKFTSNNTNSSNVNGVGGRRRKTRNKRKMKKTRKMRKYNK